VTPDADLSPELADSERGRSEEVQAALYRIAELAGAAQDMQEFYEAVHGIVGELMYANNFFIALHDERRQLVNWPYYVDEVDLDVPDPNRWDAFGAGDARGTTAYVLRTGEPQLITAERLEALIQQREVELVGVTSGEGGWLGVPLKAEGQTVGVLAVQSYSKAFQYSDEDRDLLAFVGQHVGAALSRARALEESRQRTAELALINSVQEALAGELELQAIYDLVGDRLRDVFEAQVVDIGVYDEAAGLVRFPYTIERGVRFPDEPIPLIGYRKHVIETRQVLVINEDTETSARKYGNPLVLSGEPTKSAIFVPLVAAGKATGVISLQNLDREHAFSDSDQQLLVALAGSLSVSLENARLVDEMRQRVAELATVNSVGQALAAHLDLAALIDLVGERVRESFDADIVYLALYDEAAGSIDFAYYSERGERREQAPLQYGQGLTSQIIESREPLVLNRSEQYEGIATPRMGTPSRSYLGVPILAGEKAIGVISVQSIERAGLFDETEARLLATIAASVGVAIQNARLFSEIGRQKQYFESLVEISPVAVIVMDADERVSDWNPAATQLFGLSPEEAIGRRIDDLVLPDELRDEGQDITQEALEAGRAHRIVRRRRKDGVPVDVELMLVPLRVDGEHVGFYAIYHDITELESARQRAEEATQAKSAFLATMSHEIRTPMNAVIGMTGLLLGTDLTPEQREFAEVVRSSGDALLHVIDDILDYSKFEAGKLDLEHEPFDVRECVEKALEIVAPRASEKEIELGCLIGEGVPRGITGDAARLRQVLLNLLSNAVKFTETGEVVVDVDAEPAGAGSYLLSLAVRDTGIGIPPDRMGRLFESFSQVDASTTRRYGGTGLGLAISKRLVELMGGTMRAESEEGKGSVFCIELPADEADVPRRFAPDEDLPQLEGKRLLVVDDNATNREIVSRQARSWGMQTVAVGLPTEALALVEAGEPFDLAILDMVMPAMDGLALAREIRRWRDERELPLVLMTSLGRLSLARSTTDFAAQLAKPVKASQLYDALLSALAEQARPAQEPAQTEAGEAGTVSPLRILLAEDNAVNQKVALLILEKLGYRADVASNGFEALEALERQRYDVVLMDVQMPELDGLGASRRICERWPEAERPRIVAMTANAMREDRDACVAAGMNDYVAKPIRPEMLAEALRKVRPRA
jgi:PAS domain S-box-containing protein